MATRTTSRVVLALAALCGIAGGAAFAAPPAEAPSDLVFDAPDALRWSPVATADAYNVYLGTDPASGDAACRLFRIATPSATLPDVPPPGELRYVLVSAINGDGEGPLGPDASGTARPNDRPCVDTDGDLAADNLDNCPTDANPNQADQDADGAGDRCDPRTYDFEADALGARPAAMTQVGGANATFAVVDAAGDLAARYDTDGGQHDRFDRLDAPAPALDTIVYLDVADVPETASVELWSDGAFGWNAGGGVIFQMRGDGSTYFFDRRGQEVPAQAGPPLPTNGRLRLRIVKGPGATSTFHVDAWDGEAWVDDYAVFPVADDHRYRGRSTVLADYFAGRRPVLRATVVHAIPDALLTVRRDPAWSTDWKTFQRDALDRADIPVRLFHRLDGPGRAQFRVVRSLGGAVLAGFDWTDHEVVLGAAPEGAPIETVLPGVPAGGNYDVEVRLVRDADGAIVAQDAIAEIAVGDVWISGGQSNMSGYSGNLVGAEEPIDEVHLFGNDYLWKRGSEPMDGGTDQVDRVSEEAPAHSLMLRFAKEMFAATGVPQAIVPGSLGGTNLFSQWQRNESDHDHRGTLYGSLLHRALVQADPNPPIGFIWFQGESDSGRTIEQYETDMNRLIAQYREDLGNPDLWVIQAQLGTNQLQTDLEAWVAIQEAQRRVAEADPRVAVVPTADQPRADTIHFSVEGYKTIGFRFGEAAREMILGEPIDASLRVIDARRIGNNRQIEIEFDGDVTGADPGLFRVREGAAPVGVRSVSISGAVVTLSLDTRLTGSATVGYGYSTSPTRDWLRDLRGTPVPHFRDFPIR